MAGSDEIKAGEAYVVISAKLDQLREDLNKIPKEVSAIGSTLKTLGGAIAGVFGAGKVKEFAEATVGAFAETGAKITELRNEFKLTGTQLSELQRLSSSAFGAVMTPEQVSRATALSDAFAAMKESASRLSVQIGSALARDLQDALNFAIGLTAEFSKMAKESDKGRLEQAGPERVGGIFLKGVNPNIDRLLGAGSKATAEAGRIRKEEQAAEFQKKADEEAAKFQKEGAERAAEMVKVIEEGHKRRNELIKSFETPAEKFIRQQKEINDALAQLNRNRVLGFVPEDEAKRQRAALEGAGRRSVDEERKRIADERKSLRDSLLGEFGTEREKFLAKREDLRGQLLTTAGPQRAAVMESLQRLGLFEEGRLAEEARRTIGASKGTFSAAGATMLGRAGEGALEKESKTHTGILRSIEKNTAKFSGPKFT